MFVSTTKGNYMKYTLTALAAASLISTAANAGTVTGEVRLGGVAKGQASSTEYDVQYWDTFSGLVTYGAELQTKQADNAGALGSKVSLKLGPALPEVAGAHVTAYGEVGQNLKLHNNYEFWGLGVKASRDLYGPVSVNVGYRHREDFKNRNFNENRLNAGLGLALNDSTTLGATYYRTTGTVRDDQIGLSVSKSF
jgi:hypothetical protein